MSMFVEVRVNDAVIGLATVTNRTRKTAVDSINTYRWDYRGDGNRVLHGAIEHRFGDGAMVLASAVLSEIALRYRVAAGYQA